MKRTVYILLLVFLTSYAAALWAQNAKQKDNKRQQTDTSVAKKVKYIPVYLGHSDIGGGPVPKRVFDSLLKQGIYSRDSVGNVYKVDAFNFSYAERSLYEDSVGNLIVVPDYMSERCYGDTITANVSQSIYSRTKAGDTVYIDQIVLIKPDNGTASGKPMKFEITK
jgi:hypothetical protein